MSRTRGVLFLAALLSALLSINSQKNGNEKIRFMSEPPENFARGATHLQSFFPLHTLFIAVLTNIWFKPK
jgi:hypothetical protein